jgi:hypothetical protein
MRKTFGRYPAPALTFATLILLGGCGGDGASESEKGQAVRAAMAAYAKQNVTGVDLQRGPCIAERLPGLPDWVADVAHVPRQAVDDVPANQCSRYRAGEASHFVELDPAGKLIRAQ